MKSEIPIRNLYYIYAYAWEHIHLAQRVDAGTEEGPDAISFFARVLVQASRQLFRKGIDRGYLLHLEERTSLRGRMDLVKTLRNDSLRKARVWCEYEELEHDIVQNRILKATLNSLLQEESLPSNIRADVRQTASALSRLSISDIHLSSQIFRRVQLYRNSSFYGFVLRICELIFRCQFPDVQGAGHPFAALENEERLSRLFERFVRNFLRYEQQTYRVTSERIAWDITEENGSDLSLLPGMHTDVTLRGAGRTVVIDTKYYSETLHSHRERATLRSAHLYQLFAYLKNIEPNEDTDAKSEGILLYPLVQEQVSFSVAIQGHKVSARTLNLTLPWRDLKDQLLAITGVAA